MFHSLRGKLIAAILLLQILVIAMLTWNSQRLLEQRLFSQFETRVSSMTPLLSAALITPMIQRDFAVASEVIGAMQIREGFVYLVLTDGSGRRVASSHWDSQNEVPPPTKDLSPGLAASLAQIDLRVPIEFAGQRFGELAVGLSLEFLHSALRDHLNQAIVIALASSLASAFIAVLLASWLTRPLERLTQASEAIAAGEPHPPLAISSSDEIGILTRSFESMAATLMNRMEALTEAQRVYAEQSLRYRTLLQTASDGIHVVEPSGKLVEASDSFYTMLGYPVGKPLNISEWDAQWTPDELREVVMRLIAHPELLETRHRRSDGSIIDVEISAHGIEIGGEPLLYASSRNITERKEAERLLQNFAAEQQRMLAELQIAIAAAQASSQAKSQFLGNISHELRTPLNGVQGMTQLLGLTEQTEEQREYTAQILHSTHDLLRVINEMLDFSMMETGRLTVKSEPFDLQTLMLATFEPLEQRATEKKLDFQLDIDPELPGLLIGDATRLKQVLSNLVDNAIKFTERGNVSVRLAVASVQGERLTLRGEVRDSGIGIPANRLGELFTPFTQIDASTTRRFGGTGLGLSITKRLLELMGGDIGVESQEGQGSLFWFHVDCQRLQE